MELQTLRHEISHARLNLKNPYMKEIADLYAARPTAKRALERLVAYYDLLTDKDAESERAAIFREKIFS